MNNLPIDSGPVRDTQSSTGSNELKAIGLIILTLAVFLSLFLIPHSESWLGFLLNFGIRCLVATGAFVASILQWRKAADTSAKALLIVSLVMSTLLAALLWFGLIGVFIMRFAVQHANFQY